VQRKAYGLYVITALIFTTMLALPGCTSTLVGQDSAAGTPVSAMRTFATVSEPVFNSRLTKTPPTTTVLSLEDSQKQLMEKGSTLTDTAEKASQLAGFQVVTASFIPEGFMPYDYDRQGGLFIVSKPGFGLDTVEEIPHTVERRYIKHDPRALYAPYIVLLQTPNKARMSFLTQDAIIGNHSGKKALLPPQGAYQTRLALWWHDGILAFYLEGELSDLLEEATLFRMAESIGVR
jgi:hypothetical protein